MELRADIYVDCGDGSLLKTVLARILEKLPHETSEAFCVMRNKRRLDGEGGFVNYPHYVEAELDEVCTSTERAVGLVTQVVRGLRAEGWDAVPACDYDNLLPADVAYSEGEVGP